MPVYHLLGNHDVAHLAKRDVLDLRQLRVRRADEDVAAFVAAGFEHSIANMYFIPIALFVKNMGSPAFFDAIQKTPASFPHLTWTNFFIANLLPVTIGNIIGGALMVGIMYWLIYVRKTAHPAPRLVAEMARSR